jgi:hypothetical protein
MSTDVCLGSTSAAELARRHPSLPESVCTASQCQLTAQLTAALNSLTQNERELHGEFKAIQSRLCCLDWIGGVLTDIVQANGTACHDRLISMCHQPQFYQHLFNHLVSCNSI